MKKILLLLTLTLLGCKPIEDYYSSYTSKNYDWNESITIRDKFGDAETVNEWERFLLKEGFDVYSMDATKSIQKEFEDVQGIKDEAKEMRIIEGIGAKIETKYLLQLEGYYQGNIIDVKNKGKVVANFELMANNIKNKRGEFSKFRQFLNLVMVDLKNESSPRSKKPTGESDGWGFLNLNN
ncbi:hypothetical protein N8131_09030 [Flavobacteriaceae bacterium]|nr:hypothetical protein [Flavobacteriaceae bacterium]